VHLKKHILFLYDGGLNPFDANPAELKKRRAFSVSVSILNPIAFFMMLLNWQLASPSENLFIATALIVINLSLYVQAFFNQRFWAANLALLTYWLVIVRLIVLYGLIGAHIFWLFPIAPMAILLSGTRTGWYWCLICILPLFSVWLLEANNILVIQYSLTNLVDQARNTNSGFIFASEASIIVLVLTAATTFFKHSQTVAEKNLQNTVSSLREEITIRRLAEKTAVDSEKAKTVFLATMSHELRTPLNGIIGASRILNKATDPDERQTFNNVIVQSSETLLELINNILDISSLESDKVILESLPFNLKKFIDQTISPFVFQSYSKKLKISYEVADQLPETIMGDPTRLRQILINLISNAVKFTQEGSVSVSLSQEFKQLKIEVRDTGIGVPAGAQATLFEPYVQADADTTRKYGGSGLGLAIVKRLSDAMAGDISFESELGKGTCFTLYLPLIEAAANAIEDEKDGHDKTPLLLPKLDILVVDDNAVNRIVLAKILEKDNHNVVAVTNGAEAVEYASNHDLDLILMDIQMPEMDGLTATQTIRASAARNTNIPVIAISANLAKTDRSNAVNAGMNGFVSKPFRYEELVSEINNSLQGNKKLSS
jgi:signal transduction histidine kinase/ActR/RegA family two-component response regulator